MGFGNRKNRIDKSFFVNHFLGSSLRGGVRAREEFADATEVSFGLLADLPVGFLGSVEGLQEFLEFPVVGTTEELAALARQGSEVAGCTRREVALEAGFDGGDLLVAIEGPSDGGDAVALEFALGVEALAVLVIEAEDRLAIPGRERSETDRELVAGLGSVGLGRAIEGGS